MKVNGLNQIFKKNDGVRNNSGYFQLKSEYKEILALLRMSDLANSPVSIQKQLEMLDALEEAAKKEELDGEIESIKQEKEELKAKLNSFKEEPVVQGYYPLINISKPSAAETAAKNEIPDSENSSKNKPDVQEHKDESLKEIKSLYKSGDEHSAVSILRNMGADESTIQQILDKVDDYHTETIIKECKKSGLMDENTCDAVSVLADSRMETSTIIQLLNNSLTIPDNSGVSESESDVNQTSDKPCRINLEYCKNLADLKKRNCTDAQILKLSRIFSQNYEDTELIKKSIIKMLNNQMQPDMITELINVLAIPAEEHGTKKISEKGINDVITIKKNLRSTRNNEKAEHNNPIKQNGAAGFDLTDVMAFIERELGTYSGSDNEDEDKKETVQSAVENYRTVLEKIEDNLLVNIAKEYKTNEGDIPANCLRIIASLRRSGISYPQIQKFLKFSLDKDGNIDKDKLSAVTTLKKAGARGADISTILASCNTDEKGNYDKDDIKNACDLTKEVIGGQETASLLKDVKDNEDKKEFFIFISQFFEHKSALLSFAKLIEDENNNTSINKMDIICNLAQNFLDNKKDAMSEKDFVTNASEILTTAQDRGGTTVTDDAAGICAIMCKNKMSANEIKIGLNICKDKYGKIDEDLAEMLWNMCLKNADIEEIQEVIGKCKDLYGNINQEQVRNIINEQNVT